MEFEFINVDESISALSNSELTDFLVKSWQGAKSKRALSEEFKVELPNKHIKSLYPDVVVPGRLCVNCGSKMISDVGYLVKMVKPKSPISERITIDNIRCSSCNHNERFKGLDLKENWLNCSCDACMKALALQNEEGTKLVENVIAMKVGTDSWANNPLHKLSNSQLALLVMRTTYRQARGRGRPFYNEGRADWLDNMDTAFGSIVDLEQDKWHWKFNYTNSQREAVNMVALQILRHRAKEKPYLFRLLVTYAMLASLFNYLVEINGELKRITSSYEYASESEIELVERYTDLCMLIVQNYSVCRGYSFFNKHKKKFAEADSVAKSYEACGYLHNKLEESIVEGGTFSPVLREWLYQPNLFVYFVMECVAGLKNDDWFDAPIEKLLNAWEKGI
ncbi:hypothetical protein PSH47_16020 [Pseudoalteromonas sp. CST5]|uniref:hypothetical protein n=1 Tax=unclassified Pseudoalteromonas TaxID=194690 RepID=UPI00235978AC|nr:MULTISPECIES: hypothetical protein [unclassified Pseudoalteromonas]MDC9514502.1 hypothetical protein [Pseudoalteromonas sp. CST1]MDC9538833.1 hypothetical protein [Pseudoalteromonas sp. CST3]MDC9543140.1 hypothetical protein [Pseudoalteromonas sp. CST2]MDC9545843.1 hypothetical protein [Pseudoalteromonas sp. CST4]MDC9550641.1 hypothetical protein [Pseudoalteromonas sp. CST5]